MWPKNCWYVAGFSNEIEDGLLARKIAGQALVMWRTREGKVAALQDRCPHRLVPLSTGKIVDGSVECGYHGLRFDGRGACSFVPGQTTIPKSAGVKTFPAAERHGLLWVWPGLAEVADVNLIPDLHWLQTDGWDVAKGYHHFKCDYRLINDNLLDLSHETYIHKHTVGHASVADSPVFSSVIDSKLVRAHREMPDIDPPPFFAMMQGHEGRINRWQIAIYQPPGYNMTEAAFHAVGSPREEASILRAIHIIMPETEHTAHYFWGLARNFRLNEPELTAGLHKGATHTFNEDRELLELQDTCLQEEAAALGHAPQIPQTAVNVDVAPVQGRRVLNAMIKREQDDPRAVHPPVPMADDATVSQPPAQLAAE
ncbi:MAG: Rieske 2Fe-2S domain-containing protein [Beijerinckiaceae bacterium]